MQTQDVTPVFRRRLWMVLWFMVIAVVLWALVWFIFFRQTSPKISNVRGSNTSQRQSSNSSSSSSSSQSSASSTPTASTTTTPSNLANTGAGNVLIPFAVASVAGTVLYYVRLRRKLTS